MIDGCEKRNRQLAFELQNSHVYEKRSKGKGIKLFLRVYISTGINLRTSNYIIIFFIVVIEIKGCKKSYLPYLDGIDLSFLIDYTF